MTTAPEIRISADRLQWAHTATQLLNEISEHTIQVRDRVLLSLSGGSTPKSLYETLAQPEWNRRFNWHRMVFFFGDERCVPPHHPESNYGMARAALFSPLHIDADHIFRMKGESDDAASAAQEYEDTIRAVSHSPTPTIPQFDLILLGLGDDGHTASLFPGTAALHERTRLVTVGQAPHGVAVRLTLTLGVINRASVVLFLVTGSNKARITRRVLEPKTDADRQLPAALVKPDLGRLIWLLDQPAASQLTR